MRSRTLDQAPVCADPRFDIGIASEPTTPHGFGDPGAPAGKRNAEDLPPRMHMFNRRERRRGARAPSQSVEEERDADQKPAQKRLQAHRLRRRQAIVVACTKGSNLCPQYACVPTIPPTRSRVNERYSIQLWHNALLDPFWSAWHESEAADNRHRIAALRKRVSAMR